MFKVSEDTFVPVDVKTEFNIFNCNVMVGSIPRIPLHVVVHIFQRLSIIQNKFEVNFEGSCYFLNYL